MATNDYLIDNAKGDVFRADLNDVLSAIVSNNSNATEPTTTFAYMWWADTTAGLLRQRNSSNTDWVSILDLTTGASVSTVINDLTDAVLDALDNLGLGTGALVNNTTGYNNLAIGISALFTNIIGANNTALGIGALQKNTADGNTAAGYQSLNQNTTGTDNAAFGNNALFANTTGFNNTAVGYQALFANTTGFNNTAVGYQALSTNESNFNTAVGENALKLNTDGINNTALGTNALTANISGLDNTAIGKSALLNNTHGSNNLAIGKSALSNNVTAGNNTAIGNNALASSSSYSNVAVGFQALVLCTTGGNNLAIGNNSADNITTQNYTITLGDSVDSIGSNYLTFGKNGASDRVYNQFTANATWTRASDERIKKEIETNEDCGLGFINDLRTVTYKFKAPSELDPSLSEYDTKNDKPSHDKPMYGFIAQEVKEVLDNHNIKDFAGWHVDEKGRDKLQGISYEMFVMPLVKSVQELSTKNKELMERVEALENLTR